MQNCVNSWYSVTLLKTIMELKRAVVPNSEVSSLFSTIYQSRIFMSTEHIKEPVTYRELQANDLVTACT